MSFQKTRVYFLFHSLSHSIPYSIRWCTSNSLESQSSILHYLQKGIHQSACKLAVEYERELDIQYPFSPSSWTQSHQHCIVQTLLCTCTAQKMEMYTTNGWITFIIIYIHVYVPLILYMSCICRKLWIPYQSSYELSNPMNLLERLLQSQNCQRKIPSPIVWR